MLRSLICGCWFFVACATQAGAIYEIETQDYSQSPERVGTTYVAVEGLLLRVDIEAGPQESAGQVIFRGDRKEMVIIDHDRKSYFVMNTATIQAMANHLGQAMGQVNSALENLDPQKRAMLEGLMKGNQQPTRQAPIQYGPQIRRAGDDVQINGYPCVRYEASRDGYKTQDLWLTDWKNIEGTGEFYQALTAMNAFVNDMTTAFTNKLGSPMDAFQQNIFMAIGDLQGFPVASLDYNANGQTEEATVLRTAVRRNLNPADFEAPAGYQQQQMFR